MGIGTKSDYVRFFLNLEMGPKVSLMSFVNNEKRVLKGKVESKNLDKQRVLDGIGILDDLIDEINRLGEKRVVEKYG